MNQDYVETFYNRKEQLLAVVCDGMGGHKAGDIASEMAVLQLGNKWQETAFDTVSETREWLNRQINIENQRIYRVAKSYADYEGMGTTLVTAAFINEEIIIGNIGDSRAYQVMENSLILVTEDHSFANELRLNGEISEEEAKTHRQRHTLTRSLGVFNQVEVDFFILSQRDTKILMLCSDGLSNGVSQVMINAILNSKDILTNKGNILVENALQNGSTDNITLCLIEMNEKSFSGKEEE